MNLNYILSDPQRLLNLVQEAIKRYWVLILSAALCFALVGFLIAYSTPKKRIAELTFMVNELEVGGGGTMGAILGNLGISKSNFNLDKVIELTKSQQITSNTIAQEGNFGGEKVRIKNKILEFYPMDKPVLDSESHVINKYVASLFYSDDGPNLVSLSYSIESGIFKISVKTVNSDLSIAIANELYDQLSKFYISNKRNSYRASITTMQNKLDSLKGVIGYKSSLMSGQIDRSHGIILSSPRFSIQKLEREIELLSNVYGEVLTNLEATRFMQETTTPTFQIIDIPQKPILVKKADRLLYTFIGLILGILLSLFVAILLTFRKYE